MNRVELLNYAYIRLLAAKGELNQIRDEATRVSGPTRSPPRQKGA